MGQLRLARLVDSLLSVRAPHDVIGEGLSGSVNLLCDRFHHVVLRLLLLVATVEALKFGLALIKAHHLLRSILGLGTERFALLERKVKAELTKLASYAALVELRHFGGSI